jgi:hypothetical protein
MTYQTAVLTAMVPYVGIQPIRVPDGWIERLSVKYTPQEAALIILRALKHPINFSDGLPF